MTTMHLVTPLHAGGSNAANEAGTARTAEATNEVPARGVQSSRGATPHRRARAAIAGSPLGRLGRARHRVAFSLAVMTNQSSV